MIPPLDQPRLIIALAGPNGAGKSTFFESHIQTSGLPFVNADEIALSEGIDAYEAARRAEHQRADLVSQGKSFVFETVLSDPVGEKVEFLRRTAQENSYQIVLCFIGLDTALRSDGRVALRVKQGGHDVPSDKLAARYPRTLANLARALPVLPSVYVYDNSDLAQPYRFLAEYKDGKAVRTGDGPLPAWFAGVTAGR